MFAIVTPTPYNVSGMNDSRVDVVQLQKRDPQAWMAVLAADRDLEDEVVTAVTVMPLQPLESEQYYSRRVARYLVSLANSSDPIPFIGKKTGREEALFYRDLALLVPSIAPRCWFAYAQEEEGWVILDDVPSHVADERWTPLDVDNVIGDMVQLHAAFWDQEDMILHYPWLPNFIGRDHENYTWKRLRQEKAVYFEQGPAALLSDHALQHLGHLAPKFLDAANGLAVLRALGGWPGVIGESHMTAIADLLDDPLPMLDPLFRLPQTLLHGDVNKHHWHLTLFDERRLIDWHNISLGPGICDLISFQEQFELLFSAEDGPLIQFDGLAAATEETIVDSYLLAMKRELGAQFDARRMRQSLPAARCLQIITTSLPYFATWHDHMPDKYTWQRINRMDYSVWAGRPPLEMMRFRPIMRSIFRRFLQSYKML